MEIVFLGINDAGWEIYEWLCDRAGVDVSALITTKGQLSLVERLQPDLIVAVGYQHIVPSEILSVPDLGSINVHPGYLPHTRGFNPNVWSIVEGLPAGATIHYMEPSVDTGEIIARRQIESCFEDTGKSLYRRIETACAELFTESWPDIESGNIETIEQSEGEATYHLKSDFEELCDIDPTETYEAKELIDILRALTFPPFHNAYLDVEGERYFIEVDITPEPEADEPDRVGTISSY